MKFIVIELFIEDEELGKSSTNWNKLELYWKFSNSLIYGYIRIYQGLYWEKFEPRRWWRWKMRVWLFLFRSHRRPHNMNVKLLIILLRFSFQNENHPFAPHMHMVLDSSLYHSFISRLSFNLCYMCKHIINTSQK